MEEQTCPAPPALLRHKDEPKVTVQFPHVTLEASNIPVQFPIHFRRVVASSTHPSAGDWWCRCICAMQKYTHYHSAQQEMTGGRGRGQDVN